MFIQFFKTSIFSLVTQNCFHIYRIWVDANLIYHTSLLRNKLSIAPWTSQQFWANSFLIQVVWVVFKSLHFKPNFIVKSGDREVTCCLGKVWFGGCVQSLRTVSLLLLSTRLVCAKILDNWNTERGGVSAILLNGLSALIRVDFHCMCI